MSDKPEEEKAEKRNQKGVFVDKIKRISSEMGMSKDNLHHEEVKMEALPKEYLSPHLGKRTNPSTRRVP